MFSHRFHTQKLWCFQGGALVSARLCRLPEQEVHQHNKIYILPQNSEHLAGIFSHRFHRTHRTFASKTPTDFTEHTELSCWDILPQISQNTQKFLLRKLPQISQNTQNFLAEIFSHRFHRFTQNFLAGKNSVKSVDSVVSIRTLTSVRICEICGSFFNYKLRVKSVGVFSTTNLE